MIKPTSFADLATPQINQEAWQEELPAHLGFAAHLAADAYAHLRAYQSYLRNAATRDDILDALEQATDAMGTAVEHITDAAEHATEWAADLQLPHFTTTS